MNSFSGTALMTRALEIIFENYSSIDISKNYRHVFKYLNYEPVIKLKYRINSRLFKFSDGKVTPDTIREYLLSRKNSIQYRRVTPEIINETIRKKGHELCELINDYSYGRKEILINFSKKNISRINYDNSTYIDSVNSYSLLEILIKLRIASSYEINVYKKGGFEFNFRDASSGEAHILSTLIALTPLIQDNSLILIDEPEISLHPLWQSKYIELLNQIFLNFSGCHIIIASHSHFLVTDLPPKRSSVITLKEKKGTIISESIKNSTFGWSAEDVLLNVFGLPTTRNFFLSQLIANALELLSDNNRSMPELIELKNKIGSYYPLLKDHDPLKKVAKLIIEDDHE